MLIFVRMKISGNSRLENDAYALFELVCHQIFSDNFFHGDPHFDLYHDRSKPDKSTGIRFARDPDGCFREIHALHPAADINIHSPVGGDGVSGADFRQNVCR
jgi:hypothetical protein